MARISWDSTEEKAEQMLEERKRQRRLKPAPSPPEPEEQFERVPESRRLVPPEPTRLPPPIVEQSPPKAKAQRITAVPRPVTESKGRGTGEIAKDVAIGLIPVVGTARDAKRLADAWDDMSVKDKAINTGLVTVSAVGDVLILAGGLGLLVKAAKGGVATTKAVTSSADEAAALLRAARGATKAKVTPEIIADASAKHIENVTDFARAMKAGEKADIIMQPTRASMKAASKVDDALIAAGRDSRPILEIDKALSKSQISGLVSEAVLNDYRSLTIRVIDRPMLKSMQREVAEALANAYGKHGVKASKAAIVKDLGKTPSLRANGKAVEQAFQKAGIRITRVTEKITPGKMPKRLKTGAVRLEPERPSIGRGRVLVRVGGGTGLTTSIRTGRGAASSLKAVQIGMVMAVAGTSQQKARLISTTTRPGVEREVSPDLTPRLSPTQYEEPEPYPDLTPQKAKTPTATKVKTLSPTGPEIGVPGFPPVIHLKNDKLKQGQYIHTIQWNQGKATIQRNLITGATMYSRNPGDPTKKPWETLRVVRVSKVRPKRQKIDLGIVDVIINGRSIRYTRSTTHGSIYMRPKTVQERRLR